MKELSKTSTTIKTTDDGSHYLMFQEWTDEMERTIGCIEDFGMPDDVTDGQDEPAGKAP